MTIADSNVIDFVVLNDRKSVVELVISDHLRWDDHDKTLEHKFLLQEKINAYLAYVESEEIYEKFPHYKGLKLAFRVIGEHSLSSSAEDFYKKIGEVLNKAGFELIFERLEP